MIDMDKWTELRSSEQLQEIDQKSGEGPVVIFKHSTRCSISSMAWSRFNRGMIDIDGTDVKYYYLDLIQFREVSNAVSEHYGIRHESPQILIILNGECIYDASHMAIGFSAVEDLSRKMNI